MALIAFLLLAAALAAALLGSAQQGREIRRLREEFDAVARPQLADTLTRASVSGARRLFASLYQEGERSEHPLRRLARLPGVPAILLAGVLGLAGSGLTVASATGVRAPTRDAAPDAPVAVDSIAVLRASRDSLATLVTRLQDSIVQLATRSAARAARTAATRSVPAAKPRARATELLPPAPSIPAIGAADTTAR